MMDFAKMMTGLVVRTGRGLLKLLMVFRFSGLHRVALSNPARQTHPACESCGSRVESAGLCPPCKDLRKHTHTMTIDLTLPITLLCASCCEVVFSCAKPNGFRDSVKQAILKFHDNDCLCSKCREDKCSECGSQPGWCNPACGLRCARKAASCVDTTPPSGKTTTQSRSHRPTEGLRWSSPTTWLCICGACTPTDQPTCVKCHRPVPWFCACGRWNSRLDACKSCKSPRPSSGKSCTCCSEADLVRGQDDPDELVREVMKAIDDDKSPKSSFVVGDRVRRKGSHRKGTVACWDYTPSQAGLELVDVLGEQRLVVKWDDGGSSLHGETDIAHIDGHQFSCTCCSGATPLRCPQFWNQARRRAVRDKFVVGDRVRRRDGSAGDGTVMERGDRKGYGTQQYLVVKWDSGASDIHGEADLALVEPSREDGDRRKNGPDEGTVTEDRCDLIGRRNRGTRSFAVTGSIHPAGHRPVHICCQDDPDQRDKSVREGEKGEKPCLQC